MPPERINSADPYRHGMLILTREQIEKGGQEVETIQKYNQQLVECLEEGRPALPPKKKHSECVSVSCWYEWVCIVSVVTCACQWYVCTCTFDGYVKIYMYCLCALVSFSTRLSITLACFVVVVVVSAYQGLFNMDQYSFPEEIYDSNKLIVMTSESPPPIPIKKKRRGTTSNVGLMCSYAI